MEQCLYSYQKGCWYCTRYMVGKRRGDLCILHSSWSRLLMSCAKVGWALLGWDMEVGEDPALIPFDPFWIGDPGVWKLHLIHTKANLFGYGYENDELATQRCVGNMMVCGSGWDWQCCMKANSSFCEEVNLIALIKGLQSDNLHGLI